jgi:protein BCP1
MKMESIEFYFQPEDEIIEKYALDKQDVEFDQQSMSSDAKRTFQEQGFVPFRRILILENTNLKKILEELTSFLQVVN